MKAFILAAGKGERMRPLTDNTPKPLLRVGGTTLLDRQIEKLAAAGIRDIIVNAAYLSEKISAHVGRYKNSDLNITVSVEPAPLETGGAIFHASDLIGDAPFLLVNGDVWMDYDYMEIVGQASGLQRGGGCLVLVPNPVHKKEGDFCFAEESQHGLLQLPQSNAGPAPKSTFTFSGVSVLSPSLVTDYPQCRVKFPLVEAFRWAIGQKKLSGSVFNGYWLDVGTPERLQELKTRLP
ncbi:MAG: nucleotidyltransferase family protein [Agarilytica sp.]